MLYYIFEPNRRLFSALPQFGNYRPENWYISRRGFGFLARAISANSSFRYGRNNGNTAIFSTIRPPTRPYYLIQYKFLLGKDIYDFLYLLYHFNVHCSRRPLGVTRAQVTEGRTVSFAHRSRTVSLCRLTTIEPVYGTAGGIDDRPIDGAAVERGPRGEMG